MKRHRKKPKTSERVKAILRYYFISAGICAVVYLFINQNAPIGRIAEITFLLGLPVMLLLLFLQRIIKKALNNGPLARGEHSG